MTDQQIRGGADAHSKTTATSWQLTLVEVPRRDGSHRLTQVYQLLLGWSPPNTRTELLADFEPKTVTTKGK